MSLASASLRGCMGPACPAKRQTIYVMVRVHTSTPLSRRTPALPPLAAPQGQTIYVMVRVHASTPLSRRTPALPRLAAPQAQTTHAALIQRSSRAPLTSHRHPPFPPSPHLPIHTLPRRPAGPDHACCSDPARLCGQRTPLAPHWHRGRRAAQHARSERIDTAGCQPGRAHPRWWDGRA
eukprot:362489-Chlamydomonas_euryale.AAC.2